MKVAFDHQVWSLQKHGGVSRYFAELIGNFSRRGDVETVVIAPFYFNEYLLRPEVRKHVRGRYFPLRFRGGPRVLDALNATLLPVYWLRSRVEIIHETYYSKQARGRCRFRVLTIYDMIHELFPQNYSNSAEVSAAKRVAAGRADHIICISENTRQDVMRLFGIESKRCSVIYLGCSLDDRIAPTKPATVISPCILYVGHRAGHKNFRIVLEAFARSSSLRNRFKLVAFGGTSFSAEELSDIESQALHGRVFQVAGDDSLLRAYYRAASVFVYPSRYEGFGIPPLEAMANGCPVACSNAGSISEILGDAGAYFDPDDSAQLGAQLQRLTEDSDFADQMRARGLARVKRYSWEKCAEETLLTYRALS